MLLVDISKGFNWDKTSCKSDCSWFGFKISVKSDAPFTRTELAKVLDENKIGNRMLFGGNLIRQPAFIEFKKNNPNSFRVATETIGSDQIMTILFFLAHIRINKTYVISK